tara:strand:+ start:7626 stop:8921 length:1296 start_codon:yes stop_codon:yes gene_type:complete
MEDRLQSLGYSSTSDLFRSIPESLRVRTDAKLPAPASEIEIRREFQPDKSANIDHNFMGGNGHFHYIPSIIDPLISRGEFLTAYTPYQPEVSQGSLQAMFEFQSMMADLMGVEVSNASLYDGSTAMIEAAMMAVRVRRKDRVVFADSIHPEYLETMRTYADSGVFETAMVGTDKDGRLDLEALKQTLNEDTAALVIQSPNYYGVIEDIAKVKAQLAEHNIMLIVTVTEALSMALVKSPGSQGADIVCGEAQSFGVPLAYGGPWLGFIGTSQKHMRSLPGRLIGEAKDMDGRRAFVVTLAAREQHIRRQKATSNICTNQGLMALRCTIYLELMGKKGLRRAAERSARFAALGRQLLREQTDLKLKFPDSPIFNEFMIETPLPAETVFDRCMKGSRIACGTVSGPNQLLVAFNETMSPEAVKQWVLSVKAASK